MEIDDGVLGSVEVGGVPSRRGKEIRERKKGGGSSGGTGREVRGREGEEEVKHSI